MMEVTMVNLFENQVDNATNVVLKSQKNSINEDFSKNIPRPKRFGRKKLIKRFDFRKFEWREDV